MKRAALVLIGGLCATPAVAAEPEARWTAATPDALVDLSLSAAKRGGPDAIARTLLVHSLHEYTEAGKVVRALNTLAQTKSDIAADARWLGHGLTPTVSGQKQPPGLLTTFTILGPFEDTGGGLTRKEGPESPGHRFVGADYSWGVYAVRPRAAMPSSINARGLPLDLYVHPRNESCTYLSSMVRVANTTSFTVHVAAAGAFRLIWDGKDVATRESVHAQATLDRAAVKLDTTPGEHVLTLKVCTGARPDSGRVRVRFSDAQHRDLSLASSARLVDIDAAAKGARPNGTRATLQTSSLERASTVVDNPSSEQALIASVTMTLAGADDLRSSKVPGLLDRVAGAANLSSDRLALVGYLAPFGANQSGWLGQALLRAKREGDISTANFAQRALVRSRLRARLTDLAYASAREPPLSQARDPHARWLRSVVVAAQRGTGLTAKALADVRSIATEQGQRTALVVWRAIASLASNHPSLQLGALQRVVEAAPDADHPSYLARYQMMGAGTFERMAIDALKRQTSARAVADIGRQLLDTGRYQAAEHALQLATELSPNRGDAFVLLERVQRVRAAGSKADALALAPLVRAAELNPRDAKLTAELSFRRGERNTGAKAGDDAVYLVAPRVFLARAKAKPAPAEGVFERQLHWRRVVRFHPDKRVSQLMHYAREIIVEPRTEGERYERLPVGRGSELLIARVHKKDGSVVAPEEQDASGPMVRWPKLQRGDVVEIAVRSWTPGPVGRRGDAPFYFVDYAGSVDTHPVLYNDVVIDAPHDAPLAVDVVGGKADEHSIESKGGRKITRYVWNNPPSIPDEPWSPRTSEMLPVLVGSVYPTWDSFLQWYRGAVEGFTEPDEQIKRLAEELTAGKRTREEKLEALFNFVADDIRYVNFVSGEWWLPNRPQHLLARRQGDCDDKAMLLISLLRAVNIEAVEVLMQTRQTRQRKVMQSKRVAVPMFDHGIIYLPNEDGKGGRFLDATSPQSRVGSLPSMDAGAVALIVGGSSTASRQIQLTPLGDASHHGVDANWKLSLNSDGGGTLQASERHVGDDAFRLRNHLQQEDARAQWVEQNLIAGWFPSVSIDKKVSFDATLEGGATQVAYNAKSGSLARREGKELVVVLAPPMPITASLAPLTKRTLPVELPPQIAPRHRAMTVELKAPASHVFADLPPDANEDGGSFGKASVSFKLSPGGRTLTISRSIAFDRAHISVDEYDKWRHWLQSIDRLMQRSVRLTPR
jgi:transglutaminase-like putative cysteine protease